VSLKGVRFEVPSRFRHLQRVTVRFASWDLRHVYLVDGRSSAILAQLHPLDRTRNADGQRRSLEPTDATLPPQPINTGVAPLLERLMADYAASGLPPAYVAKPVTPTSTATPQESEEGTHE
jgi:hypothetical protein